MLERLKEVCAIAKNIQETDIQTFILKNNNKYSSVFLSEIANQWLAQQKAKHKLPTWFFNEKIIFPPPLSVEQASSEQTAHYKAKLFKNRFEADVCVDLTGGMGLDTWALAQEIKKVIYIEQNEYLAMLATYNFDVLEQKNIETFNKDVTKLNDIFFKEYHYFYLDPHRRDKHKNKIYAIEDCEPNLLNIKHLLNNYLVKYSPMLDIKLALQQLGNIAEVHVVAIENEVKELLFLSKKQNAINTQIFCINFQANNTIQAFNFDFGTEESINITYSDPKKYIYEPNASILKAGAFKSIAKAYKLEKIAPNSHLYTSDVLVENFSGRSFICEAVCRFDKKEILANLPDKKANISTRNFPLKPQEIKQKLGLQDGGETYIFATESNKKQKIILVCKKVIK